MDSKFARSFCVVALCGSGLLAHLSCATSDSSTVPGDGGVGSDVISGDVPACGQEGQPCCSTGDACEATEFCNAGVCRPTDPGDIGKPCTMNSDCMSGLCGYLQGADSGMMPASPTVCTQPCAADTQCLSGWSCTAIIMGQGACTCTPQPEECDGRDDNCDGKVDEEPGADNACTQENGVPEKCVGGQCTCVNECSGQCVDLTNDPNNCGACNTACTPIVGMCTNSVCVCAATLCPSGDGGAGADGGTETCVDTTSDPNNCGGCGALCVYTCSNAQCGPLELVAAGFDGATAIASDGTNVYWMTTSFDGSIEKCAVAGCNNAGTQIAASVENDNNVNGGGLLSVAGAYVFWPDEASVMEVPTAGSTPASFAAPASSSPYAIATDGTNVCWTDVDLGILKCAIGASCAAPTTVLSLATLGGSDFAPQLIAVDSTYVYWSDASDGIYSYPLAGGTKVTLSPTSASVFPIVLLASGGRLYWTDFGGAVNTVLATSTSATIYYPDSGAYGLATDGTNLYWTNNSLGAVRKCALGASCTSPTNVALGLDAPTFMAVDMGHTYWIAGSNTQAIYEFSK